MADPKTRLKLNGTLFNRNNNQDPGEEEQEKNAEVTKPDEPEKQEDEQPPDQSVQVAADDNQPQPSTGESDKKNSNAGEQDQEKEKERNILNAEEQEKEREAEKRNSTAGEQIQERRSSKSSDTPALATDQNPPENGPAVEIKEYKKMSEEAGSTSGLSESTASKRASGAAAGAVDAPSGVSKQISMESISSREDGDEESDQPENIVWEWEQELEEYDEPDVYPSEKDYVMVPTLVEITDEEELAELEKQEAEAAALAAAAAVAEPKPKQVVKEEVQEKVEKEVEDGESTQAPEPVSEVADKTVEDVVEMVDNVEVLEKTGAKEEVVDDSEAHTDKRDNSRQSVSGGAAESAPESGTEKEKEGRISATDSKEKLTGNDESDTETKEQADKTIETGGEEKTNVDTTNGDKGEKKSADPNSETKSKKKEEIESDADKTEPAKDIKSEEKTEDSKKEDKTAEDENDDNVEKSEGSDKSKSADEENNEKGEGATAQDDQGDTAVETNKEENENTPVDEGSKEMTGNTEEKDAEEKAGEEPSDEKEKEPEVGDKSATDEDQGKTSGDLTEENEGKEETGEEDQKQKEEEEKIAKAEEEEKKKKESSGKSDGQDARSLTTEDGGDQGDEFDVPGLPDPEPEMVEPPPKRYKTVLVRTLVPRPPKIHYVPEEERKTHTTSDKYVFRKRPFFLVKSYGYDCQRMANLHILDRETLVFMSGFILTFFNYKTGEQSYLRCIGGSCFGALAVHPSMRLFAAAEKGDNPIVGIWSWPKLQLFRKLREGTNKSYASVNFSPCGRFLATQGGEPDYLITVYNWLAEKPVVRVKSHAQDVYRVTFSKELAGRLTTSGLCHIKFWKMATTFTGLKLKGDIGRFGRTELSDIEGYIEMPDGKVLSGTEWGNLLLWENGLIVAEICIKPEIPCHEGIIRQVLHSEGEFYTTGQDGWVKTWPFDTVDSAEIQTTEESIKVAVKSSGQVLVRENADIWYIVPDFPEENSSSVYWFAQDGKGAIMRVDLSFLNTAKDPYPVLTAHGGSIVGCATSRINCILATLGEDGQIRVYDYLTHKILASKTFSAPGSVLLWPGVHFDQNCCTMLAGFADGTFRVIILSGENNGKDTLPMSLELFQVRKPHSRHLTCMDIDASVRYLATGSEDGTIFFFDIKDDYAPLVFVNMPDYKSVKSLKWIKMENKDGTEDEPQCKIITGLDGATIVELMMPNVADIDNTITYHYTDTKFIRRLDFVSIKSELLHNEDMERERQAEEQRNEALEMENRKRIEEGLETESQQNLRLLEEAEELEREKAEMGPKKKWVPYRPPTQSPIALMIPSIIDTEEVFLSMGGYDTGYLYLMRFEEADKSNVATECFHEPTHAMKFEESKDKAVTAYALNPEGDYIFWGFADGRIRVQNLEYPFALENIDKHWTEGIHDCVRGRVTSICLDKDGAFLFTTGQDGNCFLLSRLSEKDLENYLKRECLQPVPVIEARDDIADITDPEFYTLEVFKKVEKEMALLEEAKKNKTAKREQIAKLRIWYNDILKKNSELPEEVRLTSVELALTTDKEIRRKEEYEAALKQLKKETAWNSEKSRISLGKLQNFFKDNVAYELFELRAFNSTTNIWSFRMSHLPPWFEDARDKVDNHVTPHSVDSELYQEDLSPSASEVLDMEPKPKRQPGMDKFVHQRMVRIWERKQRKHVRARVWRDFLRTEPKGKDLREEDKAIEEARANMGDMKLKSAADYKVPESKKLTEHRGRKRLVQLEETMFRYKSDFNDQMLILRKEKVARLKRMNEYRAKIAECQAALLEEDKKPIPDIKPMVITENPHRTMQYTVEDVKEYKRQIEERLKAAAPAAKAVKKQEGTAVKRKGPGIVPLRTTATLTKANDPQSENKDEQVARCASLALGSYVEPVINIPSALELQINRAKVIESKFWQDHYIDKIAEEKMYFDAKLNLLRHRKLKVDYLLKTADARLVLLTQEFILAQQSEALEASLELKIHETAKDKRECTGVMKNVNKKLDHVKKEMETIVRQKQALLQEVLNIAANRAPAFEKYLTRVFNKRVPKSRSRQSIVPSASSMMDFDSDDDESSDSSDDDMDLDDEDDDGLDPDFPPPELNKEIYDSVVDIRSRRWKIDEHESSTREQMEELTLTVNQYKQRINTADREYEKGRRELDIFRKEKQEKQNVLHCAVTMKLHQIEDLERDLSNALVTENRSIDQLMHRIPELHKEKVKQRMAGTDMKKLNLQLHREKVQFQRRLHSMHQKCDEEMRRKFGQIRPVEELEFFTVDPRVATLRNELKLLEEQNLRALEDIEMQIQEAKRAHSVETMRHITRLNTVAYVADRVHAMNKDMEEQMKKLPSELEDTMVSREIAFLKVVLTDQWNTISALSLEIAQLTKRQKEPLPPIKPRKL